MQHHSKRDTIRLTPNASRPLLPFPEISIVDVDVVGATPVIHQARGHVEQSVLDKITELHQLWAPKASQINPRYTPDPYLDKCFSSKQYLDRRTAGQGSHRLIIDDEPSDDYACQSCIQNKVLCISKKDGASPFLLRPLAPVLRAPGASSAQLGCFLMTKDAVKDSRVHWEGRGKRKRAM